MERYVGQEPVAREWFATGDLVEIRGERVVFLGRKSEALNVGGSKVYPAEVEEEIRQVDGVVNARVYGQRSSFAGQLVSVDVVPAPAASEPELRARIMEHCQKLPAQKRPRFIQFVRELPETGSRKVVRHENEGT
jgi:acyl-coenzyme A synthetase/AMP-(fatty) acid ligase